MGAADVIPYRNECRRHLSTAIKKRAGLRTNIRPITALQCRLDIIPTTSTTYGPLVINSVVYVAVPLWSLSDRRRPGIHFEPPNACFSSIAVMLASLR